MQKGISPTGDLTINETTNRFLDDPLEYAGPYPKTKWHIYIYIRTVRKTGLKIMFIFISLIFFIYFFHLLFKWKFVNVIYIYWII